jgi:hypothetical protein
VDPQFGLPAPGISPICRRAISCVACRDLIALGGATQVRGAGAGTHCRPPVACRPASAAQVLSPARWRRPKLLLLDEPTAISIRSGNPADGLAEGALGRPVSGAITTSTRRPLRRSDHVMEGRIAADGNPATVLDGPQVRQVFGIERVSGEWRPAISLQADPRSSP